jgi:pectinesterase inhibitor-like protein
LVNETSNPEDVFRAAVQVALDELGAVFVRYTDVGKGAADSVTKSAIGVCKKQLDDAIEDLKEIAGLRADQVVHHVNDLRVWLSAAMTYMYTCADGFDKPELKDAMDKLLQNSTELSSNALAIITKVGEFTQIQEDYKKKSAGGSRRLLGWNVGTTEESRRRLLVVKGRLDVIADVRDASRRLLSETLDEITEMSHDGSRRLHSFMLTDDDSDLKDGSGPEFDVVGRRRLMMSMDGSMFSGISNLTKETDFVRRRLLSMSFNDASSSESGGEVRYDQDGNKRRLLSMSFNSASAKTGTQVSYDQEGSRRRLLSAQIESIADMSAHINRRLLATELPEDLAGKRQLLSNTLIMVHDVAKEANCQLEAIDNGEEDERRVLTTDVIGTIEDLDDHNSPNHQHRALLSAGAFPEWVPSHARRLLQLPRLQKPNAVVAADGSGNFKTITEALNAAPKKSITRFVIYVKAGDYKEYVTIPKDLTNIFMYGDGPTKTRIIGDRSSKGGFRTILTPTFCKLCNLFSTLVDPGYVFTKLIAMDAWLQRPRRSGSSASPWPS